MHTNPPDDVRALYERYRSAVPVEATDGLDRLAHVPELIRFLHTDGSPAAGEMLDRLLLLTQLPRD